MLETRTVTHLWIQALPSPDIGRQRVFTACLWKIETRPGGSAVCSSPDSSRVCIAVGLERGPLERCQWKGQPGTRIFGFWILDSVELDSHSGPAGFYARILDLGSSLAKLGGLILDFGFSGSSGREQG